MKAYGEDPLYYLSYASMDSATQSAEHVSYSTAPSITGSWIYCGKPVVQTELGVSVPGGALGPCSGRERRIRRGAYVVALEILTWPPASYPRSLSTRLR